MEKVTKSVEENIDLAKKIAIILNITPSNKTIFESLGMICVAVNKDARIMINIFGDISVSSPNLFEQVGIKDILLKNGFKLS